MAESGSPLPYRPYAPSRRRPAGSVAQANPVVLGCASPTLPFDPRRREIPRKPKVRMSGPKTQSLGAVSVPTCITQASCPHRLQCHGKRESFYRQNAMYKGRYTRSSTTLKGFGCSTYWVPTRLPYFALNLSRDFVPYLFKDLTSTGLMRSFMPAENHEMGSCGRPENHEMEGYGRSENHETGGRRTRCCQGRRHNRRFSTNDFP